MAALVNYTCKSFIEATLGLVLSLGTLVGETDATLLYQTLNT